ncbi:MAG: hypothetical protein M1834_003462 [Cirrosporium novae-zelandiae]|nr:MAG: hypothetical protein M1834_003462 [Cirrosporium novae-zelandiae]
MTFFSGTSVNLLRIKSPRPLLRVLGQIQPRHPRCFNENPHSTNVTVRAFSTTDSALSWWAPKVPADENIDPEPSFSDGDANLTKPDILHTNYVPRRIHILGIGNVGTFVAHALAGIPNRPPITLLLHRQVSLHQWNQSNQSLELVTRGLSEFRSGFEVELNEWRDTEDRSPENIAQNDIWEYKDSNSDADTIGLSELNLNDKQEPIYNLIVAVSTPFTVRALRPYKDRLGPQSTILFLQNGMGVQDEVNKELFPDIKTRPKYMLGIITHGLAGRRRYSVIQHGFGTMAVGLVPNYPLQYLHKPELDAESILKKRLPSWTPVSSRYLLRTLTRTPSLVAAGFAPTDLVQQQLEKLAVNCIINPLTTLFDCTNGELLYDYSITRVMRLLLAEISLVVRSLPELQGLPNVNIRFSPERLETVVVSVAANTAQNHSSMLQAVRRGKQTEVNYINGYIVRRGEELGIKCVMNYMIQHMVHGKSRQQSKRIASDMPIEGYNDP